MGGDGAACSIGGRCQGGWGVKAKEPALGDMHGMATQLSDFDVIFEVQNMEKCWTAGKMITFCYSLRGSKARSYEGHWATDEQGSRGGTCTDRGDGGSPIGGRGGFGG